MRYNNRLTTRDLLSNPAMSDILPQFERGQKQLSADEKGERTKEYLTKILGGTINVDGDLEVNGEHNQIMRQVEQLAAELNEIFDSVPSIAQAVTANTPLFTPYNSVAQIQEAHGTGDRLEGLSVVLNNLRYNPDIAPINNDRDYKARQRAWLKQVGHPLHGTI